MNQRIRGLDILRAISAILVVLYHYTFRYAQHGVFGIFPVDWPFRVPWGCLAIVTFFLLSGFFSYKETHSQGTNHFISYVIKRMLRLFPAFWAAIIITSFTELIFFPEAVLPIREIITNFVMVPNMLGANYVDGAYWTLQYELVFAVWISVAIAINKKNTMNYILLFLVALSIPLFYLTSLYSGAIIFLLRFFMMPEYIGIFALGYFTNSLISNAKAYIWRYAVMIAACFLSCFLWLSTDRFLFLLGSWGVMMYIIFRKNSFLNRENALTKVLHKIAAVSYPLYLLHQNIGYCIMNFIQKQGISSEFIIIIPIIVSFVLAYLINQFIEKPMGRFGRSVIDYVRRSKN